MYGTKRFIHIQGRAIPGIQTSEPWSQPVELPNGKKIVAQFANILTLRSTNPLDVDGNEQEVTTYLAETPENLRFSTLRFTEVEGLDVENGSRLTHAVLEARRAEDIQKRQLARAAANVAPVMAFESDSDEDESMVDGKDAIEGAIG